MVDPGKAIIIAALIAFAGVVLTKIYEYLQDNRSLHSITVENRKAICAEWQGTTQQDRGPQGLPIPVTLNVRLRTSWRKIKGEATVSGGGDVLTVQLKGGFKTDNLLYFDYDAKNKLNFGKAVLKLNANRNQLVGKIIGYGNMSQDIISGDTTLNRVN